MNELVVCAVYDSAVKCFMAPFVVRSVGEAIRGFMDAVNDPKMEFGKHPSDYVLYHVSQWYADKGQMLFMEPVKLIGAQDCFKTLDLKAQKFEWKDMYSDGFDATDSGRGVPS